MIVESSVLQKYALFGGLTADQIAHLLPFMEIKEFQAGEIIIKERVFNDSIYFLISGEILVSKGGVQIAEMKEGDTFGEMEIIEIVPTVATITAQTPVSAMSLSNKNLHKIYKADIVVFSMIIMNLARELSRRLRRMDMKAVAHAYGYGNGGGDEE